MHLGLIVGIGPASTDYYYRYLINAFSKAGLELELTMAHADAATLLRHQAEGNVSAQLEIYTNLSRKLKAAGADVLAITSIAGHFCIQEFSNISPLPIINLIEAVNLEISKLNYKKVGIIGTRVVMESLFYGAITNAKVIAPDPDILTKVHDAYISMATLGLVTESQRNIFLNACNVLVEQSNVEAVMLAGTDLELAFKDCKLPFPVINCAQIHAAAIANVAM